jgi:hypothetical protein
MLRPAPSARTVQTYVDGLQEVIVYASKRQLDMRDADQLVQTAVRVMKAQGMIDALIIPELPRLTAEAMRFLAAKVCTESAGPCKPSASKLTVKFSVVLLASKRGGGHAERNSTDQDGRRRTLSRSCQATSVFKGDSVEWS